MSHSFVNRFGHEARTRLLHHFNESWSTGIVPQDWKVSRIVSLLKPGKSSLDIASPRRITLASCVGSVMERIISAQQEWFLENRQLFAKCTPGFRRSRSSVNSAIDIVSSIEQHGARKRITGAVFLDNKIFVLLI